MKLHLYHRENDVLAGYTNVWMGVENARQKLDELVDDAEVTELVANNILEYVPLEHVSDFLAHMLRKLRKNGTIIITGIDAYSVCKDYVEYKLTLEDMNLFLHGEQQSDTDIKMTTLALHGLANHIEQEFGMKILRKTIEDYTYIIEAQRQ